MSNKLEILKNSLVKKEQDFSRRIGEHFDTVKQSNGQPLNDKRNGAATLNKWERQNDLLRKLSDSIETTKRAIAREEDKIQFVAYVSSALPQQILALLEIGVITQWRKHPNTFFVKGVEKARIVYDDIKNVVAHRYLRDISDKEQYSTFRDVYNDLNRSLNIAKYKKED